MNELGLQFLQAYFGLLPLGEIADETGKETLIAHLHFADGEFHRERRAVFALADDDAADADNSPLAGPQVTLQITVVIFAIRRGHQSLDVFCHHIGGGITKQPLCCGAEGLDDPAFIDDDGGVGNAVENRLQMCRARLRLFGACRRRAPQVVQNCTAPANSNAGEREQQALHEVVGSERAIREIKPKCEAKRSRKQPRSPAPHSRCNQHGRDQQYVRDFGAQHGGQGEFDGDAEADGQDCNGVLPQAPAPTREWQRGAGCIALRAVNRISHQALGSLKFKLVSVAPPPIKSEIQSSIQRFDASAPATK